MDNETIFKLAVLNSLQENAKTAIRRWKSREQEAKEMIEHHELELYKLQAITRAQLGSAPSSFRAVAA